MTNSRPRLSLPSLAAAAAFVFICTQAAHAQDAPRPAAAPSSAPAAAPAPAKAEATHAKAIDPAAPATADATAATAATTAATGATDAASPTAKPANAAPEKCACEVPDEPDPASSPASAAALGEQVSASANAPSATAAPALFPRPALGGSQSSGTQQQQTAPTWTPLTNEQKMKRAARNAFFNPIGIGRTFISSAITQYNEDDQPHKTTEDEIADFGTRFAINFSRRATRTLLGSGVYPILFNQDPRYDRAEEGTPVVKRVGHAISRVFVQRGDSGNLQPAVSRWAGSLSASALSNLWERSTPGHDRIGSDATFKRFANSFVSDSINFLFTEFWPDISKIFGR